MEALSIFLKFLQACIAPVTMISGVGLFLLVVTNRLGRTIDRSRHLIEELDIPDIKRKSEKQNEIKVFYKRSKILRNSIAFILIGMISSCMIIPLLFIMSFTAINLNIIGYVLFLITVISLLIALIYFFRDILYSLHAIKLEAKDYI